MIINLGCFAVLRCAGNCESRIRSSLLENISGNISVDISENIRGCNRRIRNSSLCGELRVEDSQLLAVARAVKTVSPLVGCASRTPPRGVRRTAGRRAAGARVTALGTRRAATLGFTALRQRRAVSEKYTARFLAKSCHPRIRSSCTWKSSEVRMRSSSKSEEL